MPPSQRRALSNSGYRSILALLAIQICSDDIQQESGKKDCFQVLAEKISTGPKELRQWARELPNCEAQRRLIAVLDEFFGDGGQASELVEYVSIISRYSFAQH